ncbi:MAG: twin-arginine translocase TatA/TatE family subunit [Desulfotignum sp.]|nr:twin-arginine translocase TatA/TatE family subunit [Desulfotignum sp.]
MFGLGMPEILLILAIALIVIGPQKLPELAKTLGRAMGEFKRSAQDLKRSIDMDTTLQDVKSSTTDLKDTIKDTRHKKNDKKDSTETDTTEESEETDTASDMNAPSSPENTTADPDTDKEDKNG